MLGANGGDGDDDGGGGGSGGGGGFGFGGGEGEGGGSIAGGGGGGFGGGGGGGQQASLHAERSCFEFLVFFLHLFAHFVGLFFLHTFLMLLHAVNSFFLSSFLQFSGDCVEALASLAATATGDRVGATTASTLVARKVAEMRSMVISFMV